MASGARRLRGRAPPLAARPTVHVSRLFVGSSSGMYRIRYLKVFDYVSVSRCANATAREGEDRWPTASDGKKKQRTYHSCTTTAWRLFEQLVSVPTLIRAGSRVFFFSFLGFEDPT